MTTCEVPSCTLPAEWVSSFDVDGPLTRICAAHYGAVVAHLDPETGCVECSEHFTLLAHKLSTVSGG